MKRYLFFLFGIFLFMQQAMSQSPMLITENFDGSVAFTQQPPNSWQTNSVYSYSAPNSYWAMVPNMMGDSVILTTQTYDFTLYNHVQFRFSHICKISPQDIARIEYRTSKGAGVMRDWKPLWASAYKGNISYRLTLGFNSKSYSEWEPNDSTAQPKQSWWKEEIFDLSDSVGGEIVQFRFILTRGNTLGTNISYGWLLDNLEIKAASSTLSPPIVKFIHPIQKDAVYNTGPFTINAIVASTTSAPIKKPWLKYTAINNGMVIKTDSLLMGSISGDSLWRTVIPSFVLGTEILYSINGIDTFGNSAYATSGYTIKKDTSSGQTGYVAIGTKEGANGFAPIAMYYKYSWSQQLYRATEIEPNGAGGLITELAWNLKTPSTRTPILTNQACWIKAVDDNALTAHAYVDPANDGATQVWAGNINISAAGLVSVVFDNPFFLPPNKNLLVYWESRHAVDYAGSSVWDHTTTTQYQTLYRYLDPNFPVTENGTLTYQRPDVRFRLKDVNNANNSASLVSIDNPTFKTISTSAPNPIVVTLRNEGNLNLDSAIIYWSVNGKNINAYKWKGNLPWGFVSQDTIGYFTPDGGKRDTLLVWISMPNGIIDPVVSDDTLQVRLYGCGGRLGGKYVVGTGKDFNTFEEVFFVANECGVNDDIILQIPSGTYGNWAFSNFGDIMSPHKLIITSEKENRDSVILRPGSGPGILLTNVKNITFRNITIDTTASSSHGIQFGTGCSNITIRDCKIKARAVTAVATSCGIYKAATTDPAKSISIINNTIEGGYAGISLIGGSSSVYGTNLIVDSNTISNSFRYGIYVENSKGLSISDNQIAPGSFTGTTWTGLHRQTAYSFSASVDQAGNITRNRISSNNSAITGTLKGMYFSSIDNALIANNEIYLNSKAGTTYGIEFEYSRSTELVYNTVLLTGTGGTNFRAFHWNVVDNAAWDATVQHNIFAANGGQEATAYAIYTQSNPAVRPAQYRINNNCYYSSGLYIGFTASGARTNLAAWNAIVPHDFNSINFLPDFINPASNLKLTIPSYRILLRDTLPSVNHDIERNPRSGKTTMGCYHGIAATEGAMVVDILGLREGSIAGEEDSIRIVLLNTGTTTITDVQLSWTYTNGTTQTINRTTSIAKGKLDTIGLGKLTYPSSPITVKAWIDNLNSGTLTDLYHNDDTISSYINICDAPLSGPYVIGTGEDFEDLPQAIDRLKICGASDDVIFEFPDGTYNTNWIFYDLEAIAGDYQLTITSQSRNRGAVTIQPASNAVILLLNTSNIRFEHITINATTSGANGIQIADRCTNIVVNNCNILLPANSASSAQYGAIYKGTGADKVNGIRITNCLLNGGYYGVYINGSALNSTDIVIDNNIISNQYLSSIRLNYALANSISSNIISSRTTGNTDASWKGIFMNYSNGNILNNRIYQEYASISQPSGIFMDNYHNNDASKMIPGLIANNEIIIKGSNTSVFQQYAGILSLSSRVRILHNSIHAKGAGIVKGIFLHNNDLFTEVKNNNIVVDSATSFPIFLLTGAFDDLTGTYCDINSNNYYSPKYIGYINRKTIPQIPDFATWKQTVTMDSASVSVNPNFINIASNLKLSDSTGLTCAPLSLVEKDIEKMYRMKESTTMGCYEAIPPYNGNIKLVEIIGLQSGFRAGETDSVKVVVANTGSTAITDIDFGWVFNNSQQSPVSRPVSINRGETDTVFLANITYPANPFTLTLWAEELNSGGLTDQDPQDDTLTTFIYVCDTLFNGSYTIGQGGDFDDLEKAINAFKVCGVNGNIEFQYLNGTYDQTLILANINIPYTVTITSQSKNRNNVIFKPVSDAAITLENVSKIVFDEVTIDATAGVHGIRLFDKCANIAVNNCSILLDSVSPAQWNAIDKPMQTTVVNDLRITNNFIQGGFAGVSLYGNSTNVTIDSNIFLNQCYYGINVNATRCNSISYNTILSRTINVSEYWYAINIYRSNVPVVTNNKIRQRNTTFSYANGINYYNYASTIAANGLIANNEIIVYLNDAYRAAIQVDNVDARILHNSIYVGGTAAAKGIEIKNMTNYPVEVKNNNIVTTSSTSYPLYFTGFSSLWNINSNNYSAPQYIGYSGDTINDMNAWKRSVTTDIASTTIAPVFVDMNTGLKLMNAFSFRCPLLAAVTTDINGDIRQNTTTMGAYTLNVHDTSYVELYIYNWQDETILNKKHPVEVNLTNASRIPVTSVTFDWMVNGSLQPQRQWVAPNSLDIYEDINIPVDFFTVAQNNNNVKVWVSKINNAPYSGDTISVSCHIVPLAEFVAPFVQDTLNALTFDVYIDLFENSGAGITAPKLDLTTIIDGKIILHSTINMVRDHNSIWKATVPQQYYNSNVIYSATIADTIGNSIVLTDSTFLQYKAGSPSFEPYKGYNLSLINMTEPTHVSLECSPDYTALKVVVANLGENDYNFATNKVTIHVQITGAVDLYTNTVLYKGQLRSKGTDTIEVIKSLSIIEPGHYDIKIWLDDNIDNIPYDDTFAVRYTSGRLNLPIDVNFSTGRIPSEFFVESNSPYTWEVINQGSGKDTAVRPVYGTGMIAFQGTTGAMATLSTRQLALYKTIQPKVGFWYFHDTVKTTDYMDVRITMDGGSSYTKLLSLTKYNPVYGWKYYEADLSSYTTIDGACTSIIFEAMEKSPNNSVTQYIDRILITSGQNLEMTEIVVPALTPCDLKGKGLKVTLTNTTSQTVDFSTNPMEIHVKISGAVTKTIVYPLTGTMEGLEVKTIDVASGFDFSSRGTYNIVAYISSSLADYNRNDDTTKTTVTVNPALSMNIHPISGGSSSCIAAESRITQIITLQNTGNMELSGIKLQMRIIADNLPDILINETLPSSIPAGGVIEYPFTSSYIAPWAANYQVQVTAYLDCDFTLLNVNTAINECVDIHDLSISRCNNSFPAIDHVGDAVTIDVSIMNRSDAERFTDVKITMIVKDSKGIEKMKCMETTVPIEASRTINHSFATEYTVPEDSVYFVILFISDANNNPLDSYHHNDTLIIKRTTNYTDVGIEDIDNLNVSMEQNIPNPASYNTSIRYSIPSDGQVSFTIYTANGQLVYNKPVGNELMGVHTIEINTSGFASGTYFYTMEFNGQRITRTMTIKR